MVAKKNCHIFFADFIFAKGMYLKINIFLPFFSVKQHHVLGINFCFEFLALKVALSVLGRILESRRSIYVQYKCNQKLGRPVVLATYLLGINYFCK